MPAPLPIKTLIVVAGAAGTFLGGVIYARPSAALEAKVDVLVRDMAAVKCRLNIEGTCPPDRK